MAEEHIESESGRGGPSNAAAFAALAYASREKADAFLEEQTHLAREQAEVARLQAEDLRREDGLRHWSVVVHHASDLLRLSFELSLALILLGFVAVTASAIWIAAHDDSLVIEAFTVPPEMAQSGFTGQAIAAQLQDKLATMQDATDSSRPAKSYANSWDGGIKVMIPDTGISVGDLYRTLAGWLGNQTHITGEVYRTASGIAITARSNGAGGATVIGKDADFDALLQKTAESIYQHTQPYRYAVYLGTIGIRDKAMTSFRALAENGEPEDRLWSHMGISTNYEFTDPLQAPAENRKALAIDPDFVLAWQNIASEEFNLGRPERSLIALRKTISLFEHNDGQMSARAIAISLPSARGNEAYMTGDLQTAMKEYAIAASLPDYAGIAEFSRAQIADCLALLHEPAAAQQAWANIPRPSGKIAKVISQYPIRIESDSEAANPSGVISDSAAAEAEFDEIVRAAPAIRLGAETALARQIRPYEALAQAETGKPGVAHALIDKTPGDCYLCVRMRGQIAALQKNWAAAAYWFADAVKQAPSIPFAYTDWGDMLLRKGDLDGAMAKFALANQKGPHFADPLEMWGEALIAKNRSDLALAKFAEADKYAPNWGRLHLKWGEALLWSRDKDGAQKQFAVAAHLDLAPSEKAELHRIEAMHG